MTCLEEIVNDIHWRMGELASLKTIPHRYNLSERHKEMLIKYSAASIYSIWEGFVRNSFHSYIRHINSQQVPCCIAHINVLTHCLTTDDKLALENPRMHFQSKKEFVSHFVESTNATLSIAFKLPTKSNVNFDVLNDILTRFNLVSMDKKYKSSLNKLLWFRNDVAHGADSIPVTTEDVQNFTKLVEDLMTEVFARIEYGYNYKTYLVQRVDEMANKVDPQNNNIKD